ncbi:hypothetical protein FDN13_04325 [Caloramator sp. E03]|uniref:hypothetical protein n=1 Tax=Caloramator sp. E03 TaxID=2576307 RepID=UPI00111041AD|nr:hypothetical protein [Caloramator sp. E03]QCX32998.1 hypothetical protein FDN13_04325 [Caloramator sp. E03]
MIKHKEILNFLENEGLEEIDEIEYNKDIFVYNFFYTFDEAEIDAAKEYANENYNDENGEDEWNEEYYLPYLMDIATDNIRDIVDEICEEFGLIGEFVAYEMDKNSSSRCEFVVVFAKEGIEFDIDDIMEELDL